MVVFGRILMMFAGLGVFLIAMQLISKNLQQLTSGKLNKMLGKMTNNKLAGIGLGAGAAVLSQSSSATTVILLGLVNAGIVNLLQATFIIMGANVGSTLPVIVFSLKNLPIGEIFAFLALVGAAIVMGSKKEKSKQIGFIIASFGMIFIGLQTMAGSAEILSQSQAFVNFIGSLRSPFTLLIVGILFSALIQSSTATTGVAITLAGAGLMPIHSAFFIILGSNIGTCVTALIASIGTNLNSKRTALIQLLYNAIGVVVFMPLVMIFGNSITNASTGALSPAVVIAYFHVIFNLGTTIMLIPFVKFLVKLAIIIMPEPKQKVLVQ